MPVKWKKCSSRHALGRDYDYFYQSPSKSFWSWMGRDAKQAVEYLRKTYGDDIIREAGEEPGSIRWSTRNPAWFIDKPRRRIWIKDYALTMLLLQGHG